MKLDNTVCDILHFGYPLKTDDQYWQFVAPKSNESTLLELKHCFMAACSRLLGNADDVILPLSGGLDSRLILGCLLELLPAHRIHAFNYGTAGQLDFDIPPYIAKSTGIRFAQTSYDEISISSNDIYAAGHTVYNTPAHNIIGFMVTQKASQQALARLGVDDSVPVWSGFLGDRAFFGRWSNRTAGFVDACDIFSECYAVNKTPAICLPASYSPGARLKHFFSTAKKPPFLTWLEFLDMAQRQFRVRATLQTLENPYRFLFEDPQVLQIIHSLSGKSRQDGKLQRQYFHAFHPALARMPVTSRFGYPLRKIADIEKLDRYIRLFSHRVDNLLHTRFERFKRKKVTVDSLSHQISGYEETVTEGIRQTQIALKDIGISAGSEQLTAMKHQRSGYELFASIGYLSAPHGAST